MDGTYTLQAFDGPIHYQDAQGTWQTIDTTVVSDTADTGYAYGVTANSWKVHFARESGGPKLLHLQSGTLNFSETLDGAATVPVATTGPRVLYLGVFPGVDLQYGVGSRTLEEEMILHDANGPTSYTFSYHVPGASARQDAAGTISFTDSTGHELLRVGGVAMYEADVNGRMLPKGAGTDRVTVTLAGKAPDYTVTLTPDHAWLADPTRVFPVAIDPTIGPLSGPDQGAGTSSNMIADTFDESGNPTWNFSTKRGRAHRQLQRAAEHRAGLWHGHQPLVPQVPGWSAAGRERAGDERDADVVPDDGLLDGDGGGQGDPESVGCGDGDVEHGACAQRRGLGDGGSGQQHLQRALELRHERGGLRLVVPRLRAERPRAGLPG